MQFTLRFGQGRRRWSGLAGRGRFIGPARRRQVGDIDAVRTDIGIGRPHPVGHQLALGVEQTRALTRRNEFTQQMGGIVGIQLGFGPIAGGDAVDDLGHQVGLGRQRHLLVLDQALAQLIEHHGAGNQHDQAKQVQPEHQPPEARLAERQSLVPGAVAFRH